MIRRPFFARPSRMFLRHRERGLTLVELMVAVTLSTLIALAAVAALIVSRRGFTSVDAASQLRDNARFAASMVQRVTQQAGYLDTDYAMGPRDLTRNDLPNPDPWIQGFNNSSFPPAAALSNGDFIGAMVNESRTGGCFTDGGCSDVLVVRYQPQSIPGSVNSNGTTRADNSVIDCSGVQATMADVSTAFNTTTNPPSQAARTRDDHSISVFYVATFNGEPTLMCRTGNFVMGRATPYVWANPVPVVQGVEVFQVLFGTDNVTPATAPTMSGNPPRSVPNRFLRSDQMVVSGASTVATNNNWRRVRSVRIGIVLRGPVGSLPELNATTQTFYPFGPAPGSNGGADGSLLSSSANDKGTQFTPAVDDRRLRQTLSFTVHTHNDMGACWGSTCLPQCDTVLTVPQVSSCPS